MSAPDLFQRIELAMSRIANGHAPMRIPADSTDPDVVLFDCRDRIRALDALKDGAYRERNQCVALIARMAVALGLRVGLGKHPADDATWDADWRTIVFIDLPSGQVSWHLHDSDVELFGGLPEYPEQWDGHDTPTKYERVRAASERFAGAAR